jgi:hypothetical protein
MSIPRPLTVYSMLSPRAAKASMIAFVMFAALCVGVAVSPMSMGFADKPDRGTSDGDLYLAEVQRMQAGEGYYTAAARELTARGYPTKSLFNWRTPFPMWFLARLPDPILARIILGAIILAALVLSFGPIADEEGGLKQAIGCGLLLVGALLPGVLGDLYVYPVLWAGALIALSVAGFATDRVWLGVGAGLAAAFCRDLAVPYCVVSALWAAGRRQWVETLAWGMGLACYSLFFTLHAACVAAVMPADGHAHPGGWLQMNGLPFVISTTQVNAWLLVLPQAFAALYLALALIGFGGWRSPFGRRLSVVTGAYLLLFCAVGNDFNQYWGAILAPLLCFGVARAPASLVDLYRSCRFRIPNPSPAAAGA